jgi:hypothetical protein
MAQRDSLYWIRELAAPYLRGCRPRSECGPELRGWWFTVPARRGQAGFFVGYVFGGGASFPELSGQAPHCAVFAFVKPRTALHARLVARPGSLFRQTNEYIRWLTHRPPRFLFFEDKLPTLLRCQSMAEWPEAKREHLSRNFFIETLAWVVRSGLVRRMNEGKSKK